MEKNLFNLNNKIYSDNNNILLGIINDIQKIINKSKDNSIIKILSNIIIKINNIINENKKNLELIRNDISMLSNKMDKKFNELKINNREMDFGKNGSRYVGEIKNGVPEGKGIVYIYNGNRYEGDFKNGQPEGKGIYYWNFNDQFRGDRYEGDFKNGNKDGKGIYYYANGDREMGDYLNDKEIGKHVRLTKYGEIEVNNY